MDNVFAFCNVLIPPQAPRVISEPYIGPRVPERTHAEASRLGSYFATEQQGD
jgi:hypothetical protein